MQSINDYLENDEDVYMFCVRMVIFMITLSFLCIYFYLMQELDFYHLILGIVVSTCYISPCAKEVISSYKKIKKLNHEFAHQDKEVKKIFLLYKIEVHNHILEINIIALIILVFVSIWTWYYQHNVGYKIVWVFFIINLMYIAIDLFKIRQYKKKLLLLSPR